ncbi:unnamed protein product [Candida verbasci]|uniref:Uncharacterized protein n=1 Tax=Candida verbasci TaxID=1227364 RepID=A0A9W4TY79_9ASCO|nr:unnamed protein product [Candida verbasci]
MKDITNQNYHNHYYANDIAKNLTFEPIKQKPNQRITQPIYKEFKHNNSVSLDDPVKTILAKSQAKISAYELKIYEEQNNKSRRNSVEGNQVEPVVEKSTPVKKKKNRGEDKLACHADNILRMAIDSTILGSLNSFTMTEIYSDDDLENSIIAKRKGNLKFDINAEELNAAINDKI